MKTRLNNLNLPQSLKDFSSIDTGNITVSQWAGAVNFLFIRDHLLIIKRSETMASHKGQLAFVGGHKKENENEPLETALREFNEETGLSEELPEIIGLGHPVYTANYNIIFPVITYVDMELNKFLESIESNGEWTEALLYPVNDLADIDKWVRGSASEYSIFFHPILKGMYHSKSGNTSESHLLWGATAQMIWKFFKNYS